MSRAERRDKYGGRTQRGIQPSDTTLNIFLYSDIAAGERYSYHFDGWTENFAA